MIPIFANFVTKRRHQSAQQVLSLCRVCLREHFCDIDVRELPVNYFKMSHGYLMWQVYDVL